MQRLTSAQLRQKYLDFFRSKEHAIIPSAPLIPENDPSVLFNTAGMQPLVPYLLGERHPLGKRIADVQKCVRTGDIDDVGDNTHLTFFEMLGNWSLGDYFKEDSIKWSYELLTDPKWFGIDPTWLCVTVFEGNEDAPRDEFSARIWSSLGIPENRICYMPKEDNWWAAGPTGPCGPDTEIFYWVGEGNPPADSNVAKEPKKWMEIWNNVFMEYNRLSDGTLENLPAQNVDTGMGLERITATLAGVKSLYETDAFVPVLTLIKETVGEDNYNERSARIIADHLRAAVHMIADGAVPKNVDQGYVLRRLIRRAIREAYKMGYESPITVVVAQKYIEQFTPVYESVAKNAEKIQTELSREEEKFARTLKNGLREFEKEFNKFIMQAWASVNGVSMDPQKIWLSNEAIASSTMGKILWFELFQTYGYPVEMTLEMVKDKIAWNTTISFNSDEFLKGFNAEFEGHQELSRTASAGMFKGGLADGGEETTALHSATHIMLAGLRKVLGDHVHQAGSNITPERLRFDFTHSAKMNPEEIKAVEDYVNSAIASGFDTAITEESKDQARERGVEGSFWEKYPDIVKVYTMKWNDGTIYSQELCGGPHVPSSHNMGTFKIIKEEASSAWVRRIKAVLEKI